MNKHLPPNSEKKGIKARSLSQTKSGYEMNCRQSEIRITQHDCDIIFIYRYANMRHERRYDNAKKTN